jgi:hypothetical protein
MGTSPGALGAQVPLGADYFSRTLRDQDRAAKEQAAARLLDASTIGNGGVLTCDGSLIVNGSLTVPAGSLNTAASIGAGTFITAGTSITAGTQVNANSLSISTNAVIGGALGVTGALNAASLSTTGDVSASGRVISQGIVTSPGTKANTVTVGYSAVYADSSGNFGANTSSRRFKTNIEAVEYDLDGLLALLQYKYQRHTDVLEMGAAAPWQQGMMAEDVEAVAPAHVWRDEENLVEGIRYEELVGPIIAAVRREREERLAFEEKVRALLPGLV